MVQPPLHHDLCIVFLHWHLFVRLQAVLYRFLRRHLWDRCVVLRAAVVLIVVGGRNESGVREIGLKLAPQHRRLDDVPSPRRATISTLIGGSGWLRIALNLILRL